MKDFIELVISTKNGKQPQQRNTHVIPVELSKQIPYTKSDSGEGGAKSSETRYFLRIDKQKLSNVKDFGKVAPLSFYSVYFYPCLCNTPHRMICT
jgi:hypothetical protein